MRRQASDQAYSGQTLLNLFTDLPRGDTRLGASGKILSAADAAFVLDSGADFVTIGRGAILRSDFPQRILADATYQSPEAVTEQYLRDEQGLSSEFIGYLRSRREPFLR